MSELEKTITYNQDGVVSINLNLKIERIIVLVAQRWWKDYLASTVVMIGRDAIEICKQYGIDWENYR